MKTTCAVLLSLAMMGCASPRVVSTVTVFHALDEKNLPSFAMFAKKEQRGSLEFKAYEKRVIDSIVAKGMKEKTIFDADAIVFIDYAIDDGKEQISSLPVFGPTGGGVSTTTGSLTGQRPAAFNATTYTPPSFGVVGVSTSSDTVFTRRLAVEMIDRKILEKEDRYHKIYEASVVSRGSSDSLPKIIPYMIKALFSEFPGNNGAEKTVEIPMDKQP